MYRVTETIHHGDYHNVQTSDGSTIAEAFWAAINSSPYNATATIDNRYRIECRVSLETARQGDLGWAHYTVEELP